MPDDPLQLDINITGPTTGPPSWFSDLARVDKEWRDQTSPWTGARWEDGCCPEDQVIGSGKDVIRQFARVKATLQKAEDRIIHPVLNPGTALILQAARIAGKPVDHSAKPIGPAESLGGPEKIGQGITLIPQSAWVSQIRSSNWLLTAFEDLDTQTVVPPGGGVTYTHTFKGKPSGQLVMVLIAGACFDYAENDSNFSFFNTTGQTIGSTSSGNVPYPPLVPPDVIPQNLPPPASRLGRLDTPASVTAGQSAWFYCPPGIDLNFNVVILDGAEPPEVIVSAISAWILTNDTRSFKVKALPQTFVGDEAFSFNVTGSEGFTVASLAGVTKPTLNWYLGTADGSSVASTGLASVPPQTITDPPYTTRTGAEIGLQMIVPGSYESHYRNVANLRSGGTSLGYSTTATPLSRTYNTSDYDFEADVVTFELTLI